MLGQLDQADLALISTTGSVPQGGMAVPLFRWRRVLLVPDTHPLAGLQRAPTLAELGRHPLISYESSTRADSSLQRAFAGAGVTPQIAMTARDANLIKTYVRAGLGAGLLAEMAVTHGEDGDLRIIPAPAEIPECITWAVIPRGRVLRDYAGRPSILTECHNLGRELGIRLLLKRCWKATRTRSGRRRRRGPS